ncbi:hypothetical protein CWI37_0709p0020 [Hamiltosporidium tvaerminnensis]|uniref:F-box domain-containing protein n=1 Tax=Hamiltosporidium tvaerminnensis TaxID=1176355 RepID=A0A4Q9L3R2_9MICR|nr:hypothetical protein CWI37_0709p0020 [Hamiltosporidium tvaerminnensis]
MNINFLLFFSFFCKFQATKYFWTQKDIDNDHEENPSNLKKETLFIKAVQHLLKENSTVVFHSNKLSDVYDFHCVGEIGMRILFEEIQNFVEKCTKKDIFTKSLEIFQNRQKTEIIINSFLIAYYISFLTLLESEIFNLIYKFKAFNSIKIVHNSISRFFKTKSSEYQNLIIDFVTENKIDLENIFQNKKSKKIIIELKKYDKLRNFIFSNVIEICIDLFFSYLTLFKDIKTFYTGCFGNNYTEFFLEKEKCNNFFVKNFEQILNKKYFNLKIFQLEKLESKCSDFKIISERFDFLKAFLRVKILKVEVNQHHACYSFISKNRISRPFFYTSDPGNYFLKETSKLFIKTLNLEIYRRHEINHYIFIDPENHLLYIFMLRLFKTFRTAEKFIISAGNSFTSKNLFLNDQIRNFLAENKLGCFFEIYILTEILNFYREKSNYKFHLYLFLYKIPDEAFLVIFNSIIKDPELFTFGKRSNYFFRNLNFTKNYIFECLRFKILMILKNVELINLASSDIEVITNYS